MKQIPLTRGAEAIVDDNDYARLAVHKWHLTSQGYAARFQGRKVVLMHREILGLGIGDPRKGDHRDGVGTNNARANLRIGTHADNQHNRRLDSRSRTGMKGVSFSSSRGKWQAIIGFRGARKFLGYFESPVEAYEFRCLAADLLHGEYANYGQ